MQLVKKNADGTYVKHRILPFSTLFIHTVNVRKEIQIVRFLRLGRKWLRRFRHNPCKKSKQR